MLSDLCISNLRKESQKNFFKLSSDILKFLILSAIGECTKNIEYINNDKILDFFKIFFLIFIFEYTCVILCIFNLINIIYNLYYKLLIFIYKFLIIS